MFKVLKSRLVFITLTTLVIFCYLLFRSPYLYFPEGERVETLPEGHYELLFEQCVFSDLTIDPRSNSKPNLEEPEVYLSDFNLYDNLTTANLVISNSFFTKVVGSSNCYLYKRSRIVSNQNGLLQIRSYRDDYFTPKGCALEASYQGKKYVYKAPIADTLISYEELVTEQKSETINFMIYHDNEYDLYYLYDTLYGNFKHIGCDENELMRVVVRRVK